MIELFSAPLAPFTVALLIMVLIAALEAIGLLFGTAFSGLLEAAFPDTDLDGAGDAATDFDALGKLLAWLYVGKAPLLIILAAFLAGFGLSGIAMQNATNAIAGATLPVVIAAPAAFLAALPFTRLIGGGVARIMPRDETDAVSATSFIGRVATIFRGEGRQGAPAEAKLVDAKGLTHYVLVEPDEAGATFRVGAEILLTEKTAMGFRGTLNPSPLLSKGTSGENHA